MRNLLFLICLIFIFSCANVNSDKIVGNWIEIKSGNPEIRQGVSFEKSGRAISINNKSIIYENWKRKGDKLIVAGKNYNSGKAISFSDTLDIVNITHDSLILEGKGGYHIKYFKVAEIKDNPSKMNYQPIMQNE